MDDHIARKTLAHAASICGRSTSHQGQQLSRLCKLYAKMLKYPPRSAHHARRLDHAHQIAQAWIDVQARHP